MLLQVKEILDQNGSNVDIDESIVIEHVDGKHILHGIINRDINLIDEVRIIPKNKSLVYNDVTIKVNDSSGREYVIEAFWIKINNKDVSIYIKYTYKNVYSKHINNAINNIGKEFTACIDNSDNLSLKNNHTNIIFINDIKFEIQNSTSVQLRKDIRISTVKNIASTYELIKEIKNIMYIMFNSDLIKLYTVNSFEINLVPYDKDSTSKDKWEFSSSRDTLDVCHIEHLISKGVTFININKDILDDMVEVYMLMRNCEYIEYTLIKMYALIDKVTRDIKPKYNYSAVKMYKDGKIGFLIHTNSKKCSILSRIIETSNNIYTANNKHSLNTIDFVFLTKYRNSIAHLKDDNYLSKIEIERLIKEVQSIIFFNVFNTSNNKSNGIELVDSIRLGIDNHNYNYLNNKIYFNESFGLTLNSNGNVIEANIIIHESTKYVLEIDVNGHNIPIGVPVKLQGHLDRDVLTKRLILVVDNY